MLTPRGGARDRVGGRVSPMTVAHRSGSDVFMCVAAAGLMSAMIALVSLQGGLTPDVRRFQFAYLTGFAGYALLVRQLIRGRPIGSVVGWIAFCIVARAALLNTQVGDDVYRYVWEGRVQAAGFSPYRVAPDDPVLAPLRDADWQRINHKDFTAVYPPLAQWLFRTVVRIRPAAATMKTALVALDLLAVLMLAAWLREAGRSASWTLAYALCPLTLTAFAVEGHVDALMLACLAAAGWADSRRRHALCGLLLGAAILAKTVPVLLLPWLLRRSPRAFLACVAGIAVGYAPHLDGDWTVFISLWRLAAHEFTLGPGQTALAFVFNPETVRVLSGMVVGASALMQAKRRVPLAKAAPAVFGAALVWMPVVHYWYVGWVILFLPFRVRPSWFVVTATMVFYFEATRAAQTGEWRMPGWTVYAVYGPFLIVWIVERLRPIPSGADRLPVTAPPSEPGSTFGDGTAPPARLP